MRIVLFREGGLWLAQLLEHDVGVQADNLKDLIARLRIAVEAEAATLAALPPAPPYFQDLWPFRAGRFLPDGDALPGGDGSDAWQFGVVA